MFARLFLARSGRFALALLLATVTLLAGIALFAISGWFLTGAALAGAAGAMSFNLFAPSAAVRGLSMLRIAARYAERVTGHDATIRLLADLRVWLFRRLVPLAPLARRSFRGGDLVARLTADVDALDTVFLLAIGPSLALLLAGGSLVAILHFLLPDAVPAVAAVALLLAAVLPLVLLRLARRPGEAATAASAALRTGVIDAVEGHADLRGLGVIDGARRAVMREADALAAARLRQAALSASGAVIAQIGAGLALLALLWVGLGALEAGTLTGPLLVGAALALLGLFEMIGPVLRGIPRLGQAAAAARRIRALVGTALPVADPAEPVPLPEGGTIAFDSVSYAYEPGRTVLSDLSFTLEPGERVALVGPSGGGKSTVLSLLLRLDDVGSGAIRIGGVDIREVAQADLHRHVALMAQDAPVFLGTVRDNLAIGAPSADDAVFWAALESVRLADVVRAMPGGLDAWIGEAGQTLSTGQARRLALARTLLRRAPVLALDEPTSGLDPQTEAAFFRDLAAATAGRTVLLVTHAGLPAGTVDRTLHIAGGRLVAGGGAPAPIRLRR
ncbi:thiol reductant ABC exporter subunit CydC [Prosthecomicrobium pneumaticum]|nr:thiol reductant ABC exporter subunit CydC [Prosthecomicrobium pneumaticum]